MSYKYKVDMRKKKEEPIDVESIVKENEILKEENKRLHQFISYMLRQISDFKLELTQYHESVDAQKHYEARQAYLESDEGVVGKLMIKVENLPFSARTKNILKSGDCETLGDIVSKEKTEILRYRGMGIKKFKEILAVADYYGLEFGMDVKSIIEEAVKDWQQRKNV